MSTHVVGVDIGSDAIRAVEVTGLGKARPTIAKYHSIALPEGAARSGEVVEINTVAAALKQLWSSARFRSKDVVLGLGSPKVLVRDAAVPRMSPSEMRSSLPSHVQEMLPVSVEDALLDFYPISEQPSETGPMLHGLLVAAVKESVLANVRAVQLAGLNPVGVDLIAFALTRLNGGTVPSGIHAYIDVGGQTTNVVVTSNGVPQFVRIIATGGDDVTRALAERLEVSNSEAELMKRSLGLMSMGAPTEHGDAVRIVREITGDQLNSLRNTLRYFANTTGDRPFDGITLTGGGSKLSGFSDALSEITRIPVFAVDPFANLEIPKQLDNVTAEDKEAMTVALGLALGSAA